MSESVQRSRLEYARPDFDERFRPSSIVIASTLSIPLIQVMPHLARLRFEDLGMFGIMFAIFGLGLLANFRRLTVHGGYLIVERALGGTRRIPVDRIRDVTTGSWRPFWTLLRGDVRGVLVTLDDRRVERLKTFRAAELMRVLDRARGVIPEQVVAAEPLPDLPPSERTFDERLRPPLGRNSLFLLALMLCLICVLVGTRQGWMADEEPMFWTALVALGFVTSTWPLITYVQVRVSQGRVRVDTPLRHRDIDATDIVNAEVAPKSRSQQDVEVEDFSVAQGTAIVLTLKGGSPLRISTQRPDELRLAIDDARLRAALAHSVR